MPCKFEDYTFGLEINLIFIILGSFSFILSFVGSRLFRAINSIKMQYMIKSECIICLIGGLLCFYCFLKDYQFYSIGLPILISLQLLKLYNMQRI